MAEYLEGKCRDCFNLAPCAAWIKHGTMLYSDFSYSVEGCRYFVSAADVASVVHGQWVSLTDCSNAGVYCSVCHKKVWKEDYAWCNRRNKLRSNYCPNCGADMRGE